MIRLHTPGRILAALPVLLGLLLAPFLASGVYRAAAQEGTPAVLSCVPAPATTEQAPVGTPSTGNAVVPAGDLKKIKMGYVPVSIFAPVFVAKEKGYFAEQGLDVSLEIFQGADPVVLTASGELDVAIGGAGPAFWNALAQGLPIKVIAPGHAEGNPVATPLMISKASCESGAITSVADLKGKKVSVNARGATEYWLAQALGTAGLTLDDIDLQTLRFPDAVAALASGAVDAAMVGEPLAAKAEQDGIGVRLVTDFPVQDVQPTVIFANEGFLKDNPEAATGLVAAYLKACRDLTGTGFNDPLHLAIIEQYTKVPSALVTSAVKPVFAVDGQINLDGLAKLQSFFRERGLLEYDQDLDLAQFVDAQFVEAALTELGPYQAGT
ncbi:MAG: NitT/TauT family transport system substrate-binding protein [Thermomicrobiales bacterium]|nr:NitT/TauT family transport system substrate-binding protein [Thermomicrobiales bacterium]